RSRSSPTSGARSSRASSSRRAGSRRAGSSSGRDPPAQPVLASQQPPHRPPQPVAERADPPRAEDDEHDEEDEQQLRERGHPQTSKPTLRVWLMRFLPPSKGTMPMLSS